MKYFYKTEILVTNTMNIPALKSSRTLFMTVCIHEKTPSSATINYRNFVLKKMTGLKPLTSDLSVKNVQLEVGC